MLVGAAEGVYTLNLNQLHEATMEQLFNRRTTWMVVVKDVLMSVSGGSAGRRASRVGRGLGRFSGGVGDTSGVTVLCAVVRHSLMLRCVNSDFVSFSSLRFVAFLVI